MPIDTPDKQALRAAAAMLGGQAGVAALLGYPDRRNVWPWFATARPIPQEHCPTLERATGLRGHPIWCEALNPTVVWRRVPDAQWPWHPAGRPLVDHTGGPAMAGAGVASNGVRHGQSITPLSPDVCGQDASGVTAGGRHLHNAG